MTPPAWAVRTPSDEQAIREGAVWDESKGQAVIDFCDRFFKPQYVTGGFRLLPWQERFLRSLYSWRWSSTGARRFRFANLHISKKNGKTLLVSLLCMYELLSSEEPSPYVAAAAASKENAAQVFKELRHSVERSPFNGYCRITPHLKRIEVKSLNAEFKCFASQGSRVHGEATSFVAIDELGQHHDAELMRALRYNCDARPSGLVVAISTASSPDHFYHSIYQKSKRILSGDEIDTVSYAEVYEADPASDYEKDESQWLRANPSLGVSYPVEQFRRDLQSAKPNMGEWLNFCRLKLGIWCRPDETAWLDVSDWDRFTRDIPEATLLKCEASVGVDLSETVCPTSVSIVWSLPNREFYVKSWCWVAEAGVELRNKGTLCRFDQFIREGHMAVTEGDMIDRAKVFDHIIGLCETYDVRQVNFDPHGAYVIGNDIANQGYPVARIVQSQKNFNPIMVEFARAYKEGRVFHDGSSWQRFCLANVRVEVNKYSEIAPRRKKSVDYIDGAISTLLGFNTAFLSAPPVEKVSWA